MLIQLLVLLRTIKRQRDKSEVLLSVEGLHPYEALVHVVLPGELVAPREVVYFLEAAQIGVNV